MKTNVTLAVLLFCLAAVSAPAAGSNPAKGFTDSFDLDKADLSSTGRNRYFVLEPGFQLVLEGKEGRKAMVLTITAQNETKVVDGVETRVVEEKETANGELAEVSRNYFAISKKTSDVFYFSEDVDVYKKGKIVDHEGAWLSGVNGARFGLMLRGTPVLGARYQQEVAPKVATDRAEIVGLSESLQTPAGKFENCLKTEETSPLARGSAHKLYAPAVGPLFDGNLKLTKSGQAGR